MKQRQSHHKILRRWHRRIGAVLFVWILLVAFTGLALNHSAALSLSDHSMPRAVLETVYGVSPPRLTSYRSGKHWFTLVAERTLYMDHESVGLCQALRGAVRHASHVLVACREQLYLFNDKGQVVERMGAALGIPAPIEAFGHCGNRPCIHSEDTLYALEETGYTWTEVVGETLVASRPTRPPEQLRTVLRKKAVPPDFDLARLVRDLHSGLFFGLGPWLMDIFAVMLIALSITGLTLWKTSRRRNGGKA